MCETPHPPKPVEEIVDLTTPEVQMSTGWNHRQTCYSPCKNNNEYTAETPPLKMKKDYSMVPIIGKRLFPEEESCQQESSGSKRNPVQLMEEKTINSRFFNFLSALCLLIVLFFFLNFFFCAICIVRITQNSWRKHV